MCVLTGEHLCLPHDSPLFRVDTDIRIYAGEHLFCIPRLLHLWRQCIFMMPHTDRMTRVFALVASVLFCTAQPQESCSTTARQDRPIATSGSAAAVPRASNEGGKKRARSSSPESSLVLGDGWPSTHCTAQLNPRSSTARRDGLVAATGAAAAVPRVPGEGMGKTKGARKPAARSVSSVSNLVLGGCWAGTLYRRRAIER